MEHTHYDALVLHCNCPECRQTRAEEDATHDSFERSLSEPAISIDTLRSMTKNEVELALSGYTAEELRRTVRAMRIFHHAGETKQKMTEQIMAKLFPESPAIRKTEATEEAK